MVPARSTPGSPRGVWVANAAEDTVTRIDPATNTVTGAIRVGRNPARLAAGFGSVWVANETSQTVSRLDARTGQLQATIPVTGHVSPTQLTVDGDVVWVKSGARLWRLDPATNTMTQRTGDWEVGSGELAAVDGLLWLSGTTKTGAGQIVRVDPSTSRVVDRFPTGGDGTLAVGGGDAGWRNHYPDHLPVRLDIQATARPDPNRGGRQAPDRRCKFAMGEQRQRSGHPGRHGDQPGHRHLPGRWPSAAVVGLGSVWVVDTANASLLRLAPTG